MTHNSRRAQSSNKSSNLSPISVKSLNCRNCRAVTAQPLDCLTVKADCCHQCYPFGHESNALIATSTEKLPCWILDLGNEPLYQFATKTDCMGSAIERLLTENYLEVPELGSREQEGKHRRGFGSLVEVRSSRASTAVNTLAQALN